MARAQAHTLEALTASLVLVAGVVFAVQTTAVAPLSGSTTDQQVGGQHRATANTLLSTLDENGTLREAVVDWDAADEEWASTPGGDFFVGGGPPTPFGEALNATFVDRQLAVNVEVRFRRADGSPGSQRLVFMGTPSENAVRASHLVVLHNDTALRGGSSVTVGEAAANGSFYAPDAAPDRTLFNVVEVSIVVWQG